MLALVNLHLEPEWEPRRTPRRPSAARRRAIALVAFAILVLVGGGCSERGPVEPRAEVGITGRVLDVTGAPWSGVAVALYPVDYQADEASLEPIATTESDAQGEFAFVGVPAGTYNLFAIAGAIGEKSRVVVAEDSSGVVGAERVDLVLAPLGQVVGTLRTSDEAPVDGATVTLLGSSFVAVVGAAGEFALPAVPDGVYVVVASLDGYVDARTEGFVVEPDAVSSTGPLLLVREGDDGDPGGDDPADEDPGAHDPGQPVGEWVDVATYLDVRELGATTWTSATGFARVQHLGMGRAVHAVEVTGLRPGTEYEFRLPYDPLVAYPVVVGDPTTSMTLQWQTHLPLHENQPRPTSDAWRFRFRTFPGALSDEPVRIGFGGDIKQSAQPIETYAQVLDAYLAEDLHALVITGDWVYDDNLPFKEPTFGDNRFADFWDVFKDHGTDSEGRLTPLLPGIGNHEVAGGYFAEPYDWATQTLGENTVFAVQFPTVPSHWYFVVDIADYASIVMLDSEHVSGSIGGAADTQTPWLESVLEARRDVADVFVTYHVAAYPVTRTFTGATSRRIRDVWHPLLDAAGNVRLAFEMHDHAYGESHWIRGGEVVAEGEGIKYLGAGHMGTIQNRAFWNPATTWYLKDAYGYQAKESESGVPHPDDGVRFDLTGGDTRHIWIVELTADERRVRSFMMNGTSRASFAF